jgi:hypothetical protein
MTGSNLPIEVHSRASLLEYLGSSAGELLCASATFIRPPQISTSLLCRSRASKHKQGGSSHGSQERCYYCFGATAAPNANP